MRWFWLAVLAAVTIPTVSHASMRVTRFGIRNTGNAYELAGGDPGLAGFEVRTDGSLVVMLKQPIDPTSVSGYVEGTGQALTVVPAGTSSYTVQFRFTPPAVNGVTVVNVNAEPPPPPPSPATPSQH